MIPYLDRFEKTIVDVFNPGVDEKILIVFDTPHHSVNDNDKWVDRRMLSKEWFDFFTVISEKYDFSVDLWSFLATGSHNRTLSEGVLSDFAAFNIIIAMTEFSITSSLVSLIRKYNDWIRCASMPGAERRMHESVYLADYRKVKQFSLSLRSLLDDACSSEVMFSTGDCLTVDLRNRVAGADDGDCTTSGSMINFPSGEGFSAPYEGVGDEKDEFEESLTNGVIPFMVDGELVKGIVSKNKFTVFKGSSKVVSSVRSYFNENPSRRNIAELGIGCNPKAQVTGNMFEDEKAGVHIAYGTSSHLGGKVSSDVHFDLVFAKNCPVEAEKVTLFFENGSFLDIVRNSRLRYELLS